MKKVTELDDHRQPVFEGLNEPDKLEILNLETDITNRLTGIKTNIYEIGKLLSQVKGIVGHGNFQRWIEETFQKDLPCNTARCYLSIYKTFKGQPKTVRLLPITFLIQMKHRSFPKKLMEKINENPEAFKNVDREKFIEGFNQFKNGKIDLNGFEKLVEKEISLAVKIETGETKKRNSIRSARTFKYGFVNLCKEIKGINSRLKKMRNSFAPIDEKTIQDKQIIFEKDLLKEIDNSIKELNELKGVIQDKNKLLKPQVVKKDGVIEQTHVQKVSNM